jgi:hypothetical protein
MWSRRFPDFQSFKVSEFQGFEEVQGFILNMATLKR